MQQARAQAMSRVEQARARVKARLGPGGGSSGTILDTVRAAVGGGGGVLGGGAILPEVRRRIQARTPLLGQVGRGALLGSSAAVSSLGDRATPGTGIAVKKILV